MKRTKINPKRTDAPTAILCSDFHLREDQPVCRTDDFQAAQWRKIAWVKQLQAQYDCPVIHAGDLFHHWKPSPWLLSQAMRNLPEQFFTIYGNHDLPQHSMELVSRSGVYTLEQAGVVAVLLDVVHYGTKWDGGYISLGGRKCIITHEMAYSGTPPYPGCPLATPNILFQRYPEAELILVGHNHQPFVHTKDGRVLVNAGGLTRQEAGQTDYEPAVYLWWSDTNQVQILPIPIIQGVVTRGHIEVKERKEARMDAFIEGLEGDWNLGLSFEQNLEQYAESNNIEQSVMELIWKAAGK